MKNSTFLKQEGYFLSKQLMPLELCDQLKNTFNFEIKKSKKPFLRQRNVTLETHRHSSFGLIDNPLLDVHQIDGNKFPKFFRSLQEFLSCEKIKNSIKDLIDTDPVLVQSMYFESSRSTPPHFDHFFIRNSQPDKMIGMWVALEDIDVGAGSLFVYPRSHKIFSEPLNDNIKNLIDKYSELNEETINCTDKSRSVEMLKNIVKAKKILGELILENDWQKYSPKMNKGDVLFFYPQTLHGSELPTQPKSRNSFSAHFIPYNSDDKVVYGPVSEKLKIQKFGELYYHNTERHDSITKLKNV